MHRFFFISTALSLSVFATDEIVKAENISEMFTKARVSGELRAIYQSNSNHTYVDGTGGKSRTGVVGGKIELATRTFNGIDALVSGYGTLKTLGTRNEADGDYLNNGKNNDNYALIGQAFLRYTDGDSFIQAGRFELDTPLLNSDDIRMIPDLYQGVYGVLALVENVRIEAGYIDRMAGWENGGNNASFENIGTLIGGSGKSAITFAGLSYGDEEAPYSARIFDYITKNVMNQVYGDVGANIEAFTLQAQYLRSTADNKLNTFLNTDTIDSTVWGFSVGVASEENGVSLNLAYNQSEGKSNALFNGGTPDFFGGANDPFYTSMDVLTAHQLGDAKAYKAEITYKPFETVSLALAHAIFKKDDSFKNHESDLSIGYTVEENIALEGMLSNIVETNDVGEKTTDNRARMAIKLGF